MINVLDEKSIENSKFKFKAFFFKSIFKNESITASGQKKQICVDLSQIFTMLFTMLYCAYDFY